MAVPCVNKQKYIITGKDVHYYVYMLRTSSNTLYVGQTNNLKKRLQEHKNKGKKAAKYMKYFETFELVYTELYPTRSKAMKREWELKQWTKKKKEALIVASTLKLDCL
jgi:putative endonuclease